MNKYSEGRVRQGEGATAKSDRVKCCAAALSVMIAVAASGADVVKSLSGEWRVTGDGLSGVGRLPGTLADAKLGRRMTAADWEADTDRRSKGALTREYQYVGKAVYEREITLTDEEARHPLELVMKRVMLHSRTGCQPVRRPERASRAFC